MVKSLLVGAGVFLAGLALGVFLLGQSPGVVERIIERPVPVGGISGNSALVPFVFEDEVTLNNCGTASYTIPALGVNDNLGADTSFTTTSVAVAGSELGDVAILSSSTSTQFAAHQAIIANAVISPAGTAVAIIA